MRVVDAAGMPQIARWLTEAGHEVVTARLPGEVPRLCVGAEAVVLSTAFVDFSGLVLLAGALKRDFPDRLVVALCGPGVPGWALDRLDAAGVIRLVGNVSASALAQAVRRRVGDGRLPAGSASAAERARIALRRWRARALRPKGRPQGKGTRTGAVAEKGGQGPITRSRGRGYERGKPL